MMQLLVVDAVRDGGRAWRVDVVCLELIINFNIYV